MLLEKEMNINKKTNKAKQNLHKSVYVNNLSRKKMKLNNAIPQYLIKKCRQHAHHSEHSERYIVL